MHEPVYDGALLYDSSMRIESLSSTAYGRVADLGDQMLQVYAEHMRTQDPYMHVIEDIKAQSEKHAGRMFLVPEGGEEYYCYWREYLSGVVARHNLVGNLTPETVVGWVDLLEEQRVLPEEVFLLRAHLKAVATELMMNGARSQQRETLTVAEVDDIVRRLRDGVEYGGHYLTKLTMSMLGKEYAPEEIEINDKPFAQCVGEHAFTTMIRATARDTLAAGHSLRDMLVFDSGGNRTTTLQ